MQLLKYFEEHTEFGLPLKGVFEWTHGGSTDWTGEFEWTMLHVKATADQFLQMRSLARLLAFARHERKDAYRVAEMTRNLIRDTEAYLKLAKFQGHPRSAQLVQAEEVADSIQEDLIQVDSSIEEMFFNGHTWMRRLGSTQPVKSNKKAPMDAITYFHMDRDEYRKVKEIAEHEQLAPEAHNTIRLAQKKLSLMRVGLGATLSLSEMVVIPATPDTKENKLERIWINRYNALKWAVKQLPGYHKQTQDARWRHQVQLREIDIENSVRREMLIEEVKAPDLDLPPPNGEYYYYEVERYIAEIDQTDRSLEDAEQQEVEVQEAFMSSSSNSSRKSRAPQTDGARETVVLPLRQGGASGSSGSIGGGTKAESPDARAHREEAEIARRDELQAQKTEYEKQLALTRAELEAKAARELAANF
jgi:hypothetical protein